MRFNIISSLICTSIFSILPTLAHTKQHGLMLVDNEIDSIFTEGEIKIQHNKRQSSRSSARRKAAQRKAAQRKAAAKKSAAKKAAAKKTQPGKVNPGSTAGSGYSGEATWFDVGLGACGWVNSDSDYIAAASKLLYDTYQGGGGSNPNNAPICGKMVSANYQGKTVKVQIVDRCEGCAKGDLDFSPTAFSKLAHQDAGRLQGLKWTFIN